MNKLAISIDLGASKIRAAVVNKKGKIIAKQQSKTPIQGNSGQVITKRIIFLVTKLINQLDNQQLSSSQLLDSSQLLGIGISSVGPLNIEKGEVLDPANLPFSKISVKNPIEKKFSLPVFICNDGQAGAWGERNFGSGSKRSKQSKNKLKERTTKIENLVYVTISSGIGGGAIVDGNLLMGKKGNAAEIGHIIVDTKYNLPCSCGEGKGHWESYCSGKNMPGFLNYWLKKNQIKIKKSIKTTEQIFNLAKKKNKIILKFIDEIGKINAAGISNIIASYAPEIIIVGGAVALNNQDIIIPQIKRNIDKFLPSPEIVVSPLGEDAPLFGVASLVFYGL